MDKIPIKCDDEVKYLDTIIKNRLRTQNRNGSRAGNLYFYPSVICKILNVYENNASKKITKGAFDNWLNASLEAVYFELITGEIVPLKLVQAVDLIPVKTCSRFLQYPLEYGKRLLSDSDENLLFQNLKQENLYNVKIRYSGDKSEIVDVGTKGNVVTGISDLTIDHVQPIKKTLEKNILDLPCIHGIDEIIRASGYTTKNEICNNIPNLIAIFDETIYNEMKKELNLILRETKGLRMVASAVN